MSAGRQVSSILPLLALLLYSVGICFPWFEYRTSWEPPAQSLDGWYAATNPVYKRLGLLGLGPDLYPEQGCYTNGQCGTCQMPDQPYRLHISDLTAFQILQVRVVRLVGLLMFVVSLIVGGLSLSALIRYTGHKYGWIRVLTVASASVVLLSVLLCGAFLAFQGPDALGDIPGYPQSVPVWGCPTTPPVVECPRLPGGDPHLPGGTVTWELERLLPLGLTLAGFSLVLLMPAASMRLSAIRRNIQGGAICDRALDL